MLGSTHIRLHRREHEHECDHRYTDGNPGSLYDSSDEDAGKQEDGRLVTDSPVMMMVSQVYEEIEDRGPCYVTGVVRTKTPSPAAVANHISLLRRTSRRVAVYQHIKFYSVRAVGALPSPLPQSPTYS